MGQITDAPKRVLDKWGQDNNTLYVGAGCQYTTIQDAVAAAAGVTLGYIGSYVTCSVVDVGDITLGSYITLSAKGHSTDPDEVEIYEFTAAGVPTVPGAIAIDLSACLDIPDVVTALVTAIEANHALELDSAVGYGPYTGCLAVGIHDPTTWTYADIDVSNAPEWSLLNPRVKRATATAVEVRVAPGTYTITEPVILPEAVSLCGVNAEQCIITGALTYPMVYMDTDTAIRNVTVENTVADDASGIMPMNEFYDTSDVTVDGCIVKVRNWAVHMRNMGTDSAVASIPHQLTRCSIANNDLRGSNPIDISQPHRYTRITNNEVSFLASSSNCFAFMDDLNSVGAYYTSYAYICNNNVRLEATNSGRLPYGMTISGYGHKIAGNRIEIIWPDSAAGAVQVFRLNAATLHADDTVMAPTVIKDNVIVLDCADPTNITNTTAVYGHHGADEILPDVDMANNLFVMSYSKAKIALHCQSTAAAPSTITLQTGALLGMEDSSVTLVNTSVVGFPRGTGAGLTHALMDTAFGAHDAVPVGQTFKYVDSSDGSKEYLVWSDGTNWIHTAANTKLAHA
jgi:hypothetical protein